MAPIFYLFLVESSLEIVPKELWDHPCILNDAKRKGKRPREILLNISKHYSAMKKLDNIGKRGRPDIVHLSLLTALDSPLNKAGLLRIYVHTIRNKVIKVNPEVRLPRNFDRFEGLMVQLLLEGGVPRSGKCLLEVLKEDLKGIIENEGIDLLIGFSRIGRKVNLEDFLRRIMRNKKRIGLFIGGFQRGHFSKEIADLLDDTISISKYPLPSHLAICKVISKIEELLRID
ncbi:hypothetical protein DRN86_03730 [Candidatus Geothermarchaeota archaeon]|nr:MAG: hypothetical protein DRN86_03730 [Candidatus Geothermarchaeota archaeon]